METRTYSVAISAPEAETFGWLRGRAEKSGELASIDEPHQRFRVIWRCSDLPEPGPSVTMDVAVKKASRDLSSATFTIDAQAALQVESVCDYVSPLNERASEPELAAPSRSEKLALRQLELEERRSTKYKLGFGSGTILEHKDGTVSYRKPVEFTSAFRVRLADVTGFTVTKDGKTMSRTLHIVGQGTDLVAIDVNHGVAEKIEAWFRKHRDFSGGAVKVAPLAPIAPQRDVLDQLERLGRLRDSGVLNEEEFQAQKRQILAN